MLIFTRKNEIKIKQDILKGVFEDNLRIIGKGHDRMTRAKPFFLRKIFLSLLLTLAVVLLHGIFSHSAFSPEKELKARVISPDAPDLHVKAGCPQGVLHL